MLLRLLLALAVAGALCVSSPAAADEGDGSEVRKAGSCTGSSRSSLRVRSKDDALEVEFEIDARRSGTWNVILLHERRIVFRGPLRARGTSSSVRLRRTLADWYGRDAISVRASGPRAETCRVSAFL